MLYKNYDLRAGEYIDGKRAFMGRRRYWIYLFYDCAWCFYGFFLPKKGQHKYSKNFLGFAAGVMIAASIWSLLIPAIEEASEKGWPGWIPAAGGLILGAAFLILMDSLLPHLHLGETKPEGLSSSWKRTTLLVFAVTLHNIPEGMARRRFLRLSGANRP